MNAFKFFLWLWKEIAWDHKEWREDNENKKS